MRETNGRRSSKHLDGLNGRDRHWSRRLHLYALHGFGALTGWIAFGYLWVVDWHEPRWEYLVVAAVAFLGITGTLPWVAFFNKWLRQN